MKSGSPRVTFRRVAAAVAAVVAMLVILLGVCLVVNPPNQSVMPLVKTGTTQVLDPRFPTTTVP